MHKKFTNGEKKNIVTQYSNGFVCQFINPFQSVLNGQSNIINPILFQPSALAP